MQQIPLYVTYQQINMILPYEFTITPSRTNPTKVLGIISGKIEETDAKLKYRPVFYLKPDTKLISGNGTIDNPYTVE